VAKAQPQHPIASSPLKCILPHPAYNLGRRKGALHKYRRLRRLTKGFFSMGLPFEKKLSGKNRQVFLIRKGQKVNTRLQSEADDQQFDALYLARRLNPSGQIRRE